MNKISLIITAAAYSLELEITNLYLDAIEADPKTAKALHCQAKTLAQAQSMLSETIGLDDGATVAPTRHAKVAAMLDACQDPDNQAKARAHLATLLEILGFSLEQTTETPANS